MTKSSRCVVCKKPAVTEYKPFCSKRCADADLGNWVMEKYRVNTEEKEASGDSFHSDSDDLLQ